jgi:histidyl-tRNA synthetase
MIDIAIAIDKVEKIGSDGVMKELQDKGFGNKQVETLNEIFTLDKDLMTGKKMEGGNLLKLEALRGSTFKDSAIFQKGIAELEFLVKTSILNYAKLELDFSLARGLNYYTGTIFEVKANSGTFTPSILGGGRYDDLTGIFGLPNMSGVGISFGIDRIYDVMEELNLFPESISKSSTTKVMFAHFDAESQAHCLQLASGLRKQNIACEIYPDVTKKLGKQFDYANKKNIAFVCTVGSNEMQTGVYAVKDMLNGEQVQMNIQAMTEFLKSKNDI